MHWLNFDEQVFGQMKYVYNKADCMRLVHEACMTLFGLIEMQLTLIYVFSLRTDSFICLWESTICLKTNRVRFCSRIEVLKFLCVLTLLFLTLKQSSI